MAIVKIPILDANNVIREVAFESTPDGLKAVHEITGTVAVGSLPAVQLSGSNPVGDDVTGNGSDSVTFSAPVQFVDIYNGGTGELTIAASGVTRVVPPGPRLCAFPTPASTFTIVADGAWVATGLQ